MTVLPDLGFEPTAGFWQAAARGELRLPRCGDCGRWVWYPQPACPDCGGETSSWEAVCGRGSLFSWARVERALHAPYRDEVPYVTGLVALEEDPRVRLVTRIVDCDPAALRIDMPVEVVFCELRGAEDETPVPAPCFRPASETRAPRPDPDREASP